MSRLRARRGRRLAGAAVLAAVLAGCGSDGYEPAGPFRPQPEGPPPQVGPPTESPSVPGPGDPADPESDEEAGDPNVVASGLAVPTGLVVLPDGSAVVGERETGRLLQVFPDRSPARELMTLPGVDTAGDGGLLGLALSPTFPEDGLFYAYVSTATDNRVVRFPMGGTPNPVLTGIPRGETHNGGGLAFAPDGTLFVGTGDTADPALAQDPASLAGKVLHVDVFGRPVGAGPVYSSGHADVRALCPGGETLFATDDSAQGPDALEAVVEGGDAGWPAADPDSARPVVEFPPAEGGLGGCAVAGRSVFLGSLDGRRIHTVLLDGTGTLAEEPGEFLVDRYGRLRTVVVDGEGALWVTTSNRDDVGTPVEDDDRVLRVFPPGGAADSPL
ncbi:Glucose/arabinose dehydrogenase, beta-propeller fold [Geodermatophilus pulveris]|uniref:Glucose/arabinose dehydrogenase, beta-propeller fold n=1 Tax=Geodermatophilus pulveris TaxID=1564159 RepID=A0A239BBI2_9ACTN|nr:PQQ-dependent sugar dehydrogenase [Geodermatophilus pulveris]SNS05355.1 Glucose/arabinose dehydrogenase, beta-propeller fold [Geodermatophilus pulveris]